MLGVGHDDEVPGRWQPLQIGQALLEGVPVLPKITWEVQAVRELRQEARFGLAEATVNLPNDESGWRLVEDLGDPAPTENVEIDPWWQDRLHVVGKRFGGGHCRGLSSWR